MTYRWVYSFICCTLFYFVLLTAACSSPAEIPLPTMNKPAAEGNAERGRQLVFSYGCGSCHTVPGVPGANAVVGPPLDDFHQRRYIAGNLPNQQPNLMRWIQDPQSIEPDTAMPDLGVSEDEARDISAYLYNQTSSPLRWPWDNNCC